MKIFYTNPMSYNNSAIYDYSLLSAIAKFTNVTFFCSVYYELDDKIEGIEFRRVFSYNKIRNRFLKFISYIKSLFIILYFVVERRPQVVHIQWIRVPFIDILFINLYKACGAKVVYTAHNLLPHNDLNRKSFYIYQTLYKTVSAIIVHTASTKQELIDDFKIEEAKISIIEHGLVSIEYNNEMVNLICRGLKEKYHLNKKIVLTSFGSQNLYKGIDLLVEFIKNHSSQLKQRNVLFLIAGKTPKEYSDEIENYDNVLLLSKYITDDEYIAISKLSHIILLPYNNISQSGVLMSALNESVPVLVSHVGGLYDPLKVADIGWDFGQPRYENFSDKLYYLLNNPEEINRKKNNTGEWMKIHSHYSWDKIGKNTFELYNTISSI